MKQSTLVRRVPPCPVHDVPRFCAWLETMAADGLFPVTYRSAIPTILFRRENRPPLRFRLIPLKKIPTYLAPQDAPPEELTSMTSHYGWDFLFRCGSFYLFCTADPQVRELDTDPEIQQQALRMLHRLELRSFLIFLLTQAFLWGILLPSFCWNMMYQNSALLLSLLLGTLVLMGQQLYALLCLFRASRIEAGSSKFRRCSIYQVLQILQWVLVLVMMISWGSWKMAELGLGRKPLEEYPGTVPFVTLQDLTPQEPELRVEALHHIDNAYYQSRTDLLFRDLLYWMDGGSVTYPDGESMGGLLEVYYCKTIPWLAKATAKDYLQANRHRYQTEYVELPQSGLDFAAGYVTEYGISRMVLVHDDTLLCVRFSLADKNGIFTAERWLERMTARLLS